MTDGPSNATASPTGPRRALRLPGGYWTAAFLLTIFVLAGNSLLLTGRGAPIWDAFIFYAPYQKLVGDFARAGRFLLWNPWANGGSPDCADPQVGAFSPIVVALAWLTAKVWLGFRFYWLTIWWAGGVGTLLLARHLKAPPWGATIAAIGFVSSGYYTGHAQHTSILYAMSCLPFLVWRWDEAFQEKRWWPGAQAGAIWGLSALGGYPGLVILNGTFLALWAAGRTLSVAAEARSEGERRLRTAVRSGRRAFALLAVTVLVGSVVLAPTYVAFFSEGTGYSDRAGGLSRETAVFSNALHPAAVLSFATPYLSTLNRLNRSETWFYTKTGCESIYLPITLLILALAAPLRRPRRWWPWCLLAISLVFLLCSLGQALPLRGWLYDVFFPFRYFRHPSIFRGYYLFGLTVLAVELTAELRRFEPGERQVFRKLAAITASLGLVAVVFVGSIPLVAERLGSAYPAVRWWTLALWLANLAVTAAGWRVSRLAPAVPIAFVALTAADGYGALKLTRSVGVSTHRPTIASWQLAEERSRGSLDLLANGLDRQEISPYLHGRDNLNFLPKLPVLNSYTPFKSTLHHRWLTEPILVAAATGGNRFWFSTEAPVVPATATCLQSFFRRTKALSMPPLVRHDDHEPGERECRQIRELPAAQRLEVRWQTYLPERLALEVEAPAEGWLLLTERFANGWFATVNGAEARIWRGNFLFRAVRVPAGRTRVEMTYRPAGFPALVALSWSTLFGVLLLPIVIRRRHLTDRRPLAEARGHG